MRCSVSHMFATASVNSGTGTTIKAIYSLMTRIDKLLNSIIKTIDVSVLYVEMTNSVDCILV